MRGDDLSDELLNIPKLTFQDDRQNNPNSRMPDADPETSE